MAALAESAQVILGVGLVSVSILWRFRVNIAAHGTPFSDWQHYAMSWNRVASGGSLFAPEQLSGPFAFPDVLFVGWAYPPAAVAFWAPFASWPAGYVAWTMVNVGLLLTALWAAATRHWPDHRASVFALALAALSQYQPFIEGASLGSPDVALAGVLTWAWLLGPRATVLAGIVGGVAKVAPISLLLYARRYGWRWTLIGAGATVLICLLTLPLTGWETWPQYVHSLSLATASCAPGRPDNVAIACQIANHGAGKTIGVLVAMGAALTSGLVPNRLLAFSLAAMTYPLANYDLRGHTWLPVLAVVVAVVTELATHHRTRRSIAGVA